MKINCAIIGLGIGEKHLKTLLLESNLDVLYICDFNELKLKKIKKKYSNYKNLQKCIYVKDYRKILQDKKLNLVIISSYDNYHCKQILDFAKRKINIFVEKPLCQKENEFKKIKRTININKVNISSNFVLRENPIFSKLKKKIDKDILGKIYHFESEYNYGRIHKIHQGWRKDIPYYSVNQGGTVHLLDLIFYLKKMKVNKIFTLGNKISSKKSNFKYQDISTSILKFKNNCTAKITSNFSCVSPHHHKLSVYGTKGSFEYNFLNNIYFFSRDNQTKKIKIEKNIKKYKKSLVLKKFIKNLKTKNNETLKSCKEDLFNVTDIILKIDKINL